jgi:hypothetical protein
MKCQDRFLYSRNPCKYPAKYLVIAPAAPKVVCGYHARGFMKRALIPVKHLGRDFDAETLPDINGFLESMRELGAEVTIVNTQIVIKFGG